MCTLILISDSSSSSDNRKSKRSAAPGDAQENARKKHKDCHGWNQNTTRDRNATAEMRTKAKVEAKVANTHVASEIESMQCNHCSHELCQGKFEEIELPKGGIDSNNNQRIGKFWANKEPLPLGTYSDCMWSKAMGLAVMKRRCPMCSKAVSLHVVSATKHKKLQYVGKNLFIPANTKKLKRQ